ncbi:MAG: VCBS repeat-containing protein, partial [Phycisphaerae bacterium]|nr:VCBS repeat-containing protein [Phycisphaerae bacterium]
MRLHVLRMCVGAVLWMAVLVTGCTELYVLFGPGAIWGPQQSAVGAGGGGTTTQPTMTVIPAPVFVSDQADPLLEATAGAKVVVAAQLNDDNGDGVIDDNDEVDFVSGHDESQPIQVHLNQGGGASFSTMSVGGGGPIARMVGLEVIDIDVDGYPDIAVLVNDTGYTPEPGADLRGAVVLLFNPGDPADALAWQEVTLNRTFMLPCDSDGMTDFAVVDIDLATEADGVTPRGPDIVLGSNEVDDVAKFIHLYVNPGHPAGWGTHQARNGSMWINSDMTVNAVPFQAMEAADIDRDGDIDIVATFPTSKTYNVRWLVNPRIPAGTAAVSAAWQTFMVGQQQGGGDYLDVADIDGDGDMDVAVAKVSERLVQWFENPDRPADGLAIVTQQSFPWRVFNLGTILDGYVINQLQLTDMNADGLVDCFLTASG